MAVWLSLQSFDRRLNEGDEVMVYCVFDDQGALVQIFHKEENAEWFMRNERKYGWYVVGRYVN